MTLALWDVEVPGGHRYQHHTVEGNDAAGVVVTDAGLGTLMIWRHRVLGDEWGWEIPAGMVDPGETPEEAARRECVEESGWEPGPLRPLLRFAPIAGQSTQTFWIYAADTARRVGDPDPVEASSVEWIHDERLRELIDANSVLDAMSVIAVLHRLANRHGG